MTTLPTIALSKPPLLPGGGVICTKRLALSAPRPALAKVNMIQRRNANPNAIVSIDMTRLNRLTSRRRE